MVIVAGLSGGTCMPSDTKTPVLTGVNDRRVDALARRVIAAVRQRPSGELRQRIDAATEWLLGEVVSSQVFIVEDACAELQSRNISNADLIDHCITDSARELGRRWVEDETSFSVVSLGSARLYGLCKALSVSWENCQTKKNRVSILLAVCGREDHLIGPVVLSDQLRRAGYSVFLMPRATPQQIWKKLQINDFTTMFISCSGTETLQYVVDAIKYIRDRADAAPRIVLGGPVIDHVDDLQQMTGADLVTNDIARALSWAETDNLNAEVVATY